MKKIGWFLLIIGVLSLAGAAALELRFTQSAEWKDAAANLSERLAIDSSVFSGAEVRPRSEISPGTFTVNAEFTKMTGGLISYEVEVSSSTLTLKRWVSRGDGTFAYGTLKKPFSVSRPEWYGVTGAQWVGGGVFEVTFQKKGWLALPPSVLTLLMLIVGVTTVFLWSIIRSW